MSLFQLVLLLAGICVLILLVIYFAGDDEPPNPRFTRPDNDGPSS